MRTKSERSALRLRVGELVEVRTKEEILSTLDERGALESLPFMPEMLAFCGERFRVSKRAHKLCDTAYGSGLRGMDNAVLLDDVRCDGTAHGGCQAGCLTIWKEAWLRRVPANDLSASNLALTQVVDNAEHASDGGPSEESIFMATQASSQATSDRRLFSCQATQLVAATTRVVPPWNLNQYVEDVSSGNVSLLSLARGLLRSVMFPSRWGHPLLRGRLRKTPSTKLDLEPGEFVRVKSRKEILATLDANNRNRGLGFNPEMLRYCGRKARVLRRVEQIIDERTGVMVRLGTDCIVLEGVICIGDYRRLCPRGIYPYWREIWLERVVEPAIRTAPQPEGLRA